MEDAEQHDRVATYTIRHDVGGPRDDEFARVWSSATPAELRKVPQHVNSVEHAPDDDRGVSWCIPSDERTYPFYVSEGTRRPAEHHPGRGSSFSVPQLSIHATTAA